MVISDFRKRGGGKRHKGPKSMPGRQCWENRPYSGKTVLPMEFSADSPILSVLNPILQQSGRDKVCCRCWHRLDFRVKRSLVGLSNDRVLAAGSPEIGPRKLFRPSHLVGTYVCPFLFGPGK